MNFPALFLTSSFFPLRLKRKLCMILIFLNLLRLVLWPKICPILDSVPWALKKNMSSTIIAYSTLYMSIRTNWFTVLFTYSFFFDHLCKFSILIESSLLNSPTIIVELSNSPFNSVNVWFIYLGLCSLVYIYLQLFYLLTELMLFFCFFLFFFFN